MGNNNKYLLKFFIFQFIILIANLGGSQAMAAGGDLVLEPGHPSLQVWLLPDSPPHPADNAPTPQRIELGAMLFFDPRLSGDGNMSCATCHNPALGWSDGLPTARGHRGKVLGRASPPITNTGYQRIQMWDGRARTLEDQALGPLHSADEMRSDMAQMLDWLRGNSGYRRAFAEAYPGAPLELETVAKAIAAFERTVIATDTPFDRWVRGDAEAMTPQQVDGLRLFLDREKTNCVACHKPPNFTDDGFHHLGLASHGHTDADPGRYAQKPIGILRGAFKTPSLRNVTLTAPYFHDGSAATLSEVIAHYVQGGVVREGISPNIRPLAINPDEQASLVAFLHALSAAPQSFVLPALPPGPVPGQYTRVPGTLDRPADADLAAILSNQDEL